MMESLGVGPWIAIVVAVGAVGILVGYWLGTKLGGHNTEPMRELHREQKAYKDDVREHFEQVSATMTRMVEDYREMYNHVAKGAEKLADMHHETVIEPPPKPEAITQDRRPADDDANPDAQPGTQRHGAASKTESEASKTEPSMTSSAATVGKPQPSAKAPTASGAAAKSSASASAAGKTAPRASAQSKPGALDDGKQAAGSRTPSDLERPQDAAIRAAAEDAANKR